MKLYINRQHFILHHPNHKLTFVTGRANNSTTMQSCIWSFHAEFRVLQCGCLHTARGTKNMGDLFCSDKISRTGGTCDNLTN